VGLPLTLADLGLSPSMTGELRAAATRACARGDTMHNMLPLQVTPDMVLNALLEADDMGDRIKEERGE
jgi:glycerol dehydrogenase